MEQKFDELNVHGLKCRLIEIEQDTDRLILRICDMAFQPVDKKSHIELLIWHIVLEVDPH